MSEFKAPVGTHANADKGKTINCYAVFNKGGKADKWAYNPIKVGENDIEVSITHCGICASDLHTIDSGWGETSYPVVVGHEIVGTVVSKGDKVTHLNVGDRVGVGAACNACLKCDACKVKEDNHCVALKWTYGSKYDDGQDCRGGYAEAIRVDGRWAFKIPENIESAEAAPLLCAGATVWTPLRVHGAGPGKKVGIVGIGGLGHLGVQFASKLGADVTAISHNMKKKDEAHKLGAKEYIDASDSAQVKAAFRKFDLVISTTNHDLGVKETSKYLSMMALGGVYCSVGLPESPFEVSAFSLMSPRASLTASSIGSIEGIKQMLEFAAKNDVRPIIERMPMTKVNDGIQKVRDGTVRFRVVLEAGK